MNFSPILLAPELFQLALVILLFVICVLPNKEGKDFKIHLWLPILTIIGFVVSLLSFFQNGIMFWESYQVDGISQFFKILVAAGFSIAVINATRQPTLEKGKRADYFMFLSFSALGLMLISSAVELLAIYLAMELASYSLYILIPLRSKDKGAAEAGLKYILFGAAATALALYGFSWIVASQGTTYLAELINSDWSFVSNPLGAIGLTMFLVGMFYKLALFPFHFWCPDVYQGASNETAAYVATLPKLGAIVVLIRLSVFIKPGLEVTTIIAILAAISMTFGNICALAQSDLKRMLGFSSVAHAGYILVGLVSGTAIGLAAVAYYALAYVSMNLLAFWIISRVASSGQNLTYKDLNGLSKRSPGLALALAVAAFSLVGLPPSVGFIGKFFILTSAWGHGYNWLVILLCINSAFAIYYYLSLVRHAYSEEDEVGLVMPKADVSFFSTSGALVLAGLTLILGIFPGPIYNLVLKASSVLIP